jgi:hypothetical protein
MIALVRSDLDDEPTADKPTVTAQAQSVEHAAPPAPSMPIRNRFIQAWQEEQPYHQHNWAWRGSPVVTIFGTGPDRTGG